MTYRNNTIIKDALGMAGEDDDIRALEIHLLMGGHKARPVIIMRFIPFKTNK